MKVGYLVVPNTAAEAVLRKRLIAQGAEEVTIDNEKHEQLTELLDRLMPGDSLYVWNLFHLSKNSQTMRSILQRLIENNIMLFVNGECVDFTLPNFQENMSAAIDCYDNTMQTIKPRVDYFEKIIQEEKARNPFKELREQSGMKLRAYAEYFHIPKRTIEPWEEGKYGCPQYLLELMQYKLKKEKIIK